MTFDYCTGTGRIIPFGLPETDCPKCKGSDRVVTWIYVLNGQKVKPPFTKKSGDTLHASRN